MKSPEDKARLKDWMNTKFLPVWRGQVDDWSDGLNYIADKTGWTPESIEQDILPWIYEWNRQRDAADKAGKFMAELPNIGVFFRKQKWKNPLPYSFQELKEVEAGIKHEEICSCGEKAFNRKLCARCYSKAVDPEFQTRIKKQLRKMSYTKQADENWRNASLRCLRTNNLLSAIPKPVRQSEPLPEPSE